MPPAGTGSSMPSGKRIPRHWRIAAVTAPGASCALPDQTGQSPGFHEQQDGTLHAAQRAPGQCDVASIFFDDGDADESAATLCAYFDCGLTAHLDGGAQGLSGRIGCEGGFDGRLTDSCLERGTRALCDVRCCRGDRRGIGIAGARDGLSVPGAAQRRLYALDIAAERWIARCDHGSQHVAGDCLGDCEQGIRNAAERLRRASLVRLNLELLEDLGVRQWNLAVVEDDEEIPFRNQGEHHRLRGSANRHVIVHGKPFK